MQGAKHPVWFNEGQRQEFEKARARGELVQTSFADFVKAAFHEKLEQLNIQEMTRKQLMALQNKRATTGK